MNSELEALEIKVDQVLELVNQLRAENEVLKNRISAAEAERPDLRQKMTLASERLEALMQRLPEDA